MPNYLAKASSKPLPRSLYGSIAASCKAGHGRIGRDEGVGDNKWLRCVLGQFSLHRVVGNICFSNFPIADLMRQNRYMSFATTYLLLRGLIN